MILDSSALVAIVCEEPGAEDLANRIARARTVAIGAPAVAETQLVLTNKLGPNGAAMVNQFMEEARVLVVPFGRDHISSFMDAFQRYGKGRHPAALNMGDCFSYSIARVAGQPLLFVGNDFPKTDITPA